MKFSWKLINDFIDINHIQPQVLEEKLALSGIEIEGIEDINNIEDKIIDASFTANRKDIFSTISLAKEVGIITNTQLNVSPIDYLGHSNINKYQKLDIKKLVELSISEIKNIHFDKTPTWINNYLKIYGIKSSDIIDDIQKYVEIKWGQTFNIFTKNEILSKLDLINKDQKIDHILLYKYIIANYNESSTFLVFSKYNTSNIETKLNPKTYSEYYFNSYLDTIKILSTFTKCIIGKIYHIFETTNENQNKETIEIDRKTINTTLGKVIHKNFRHISYRNLLSAFGRLYLSPKYDQLSKKFLVKVPKDRINDLTRTIDIIEEIGRIQGYNSFSSQLYRHSIKGKVSENSIKVKQIRKILRRLGLNEVINSCLVNHNPQNNGVKIYNPITQEQSGLRSSILENLINNYVYNHKKRHNNYEIEIFEFGKIFKNISGKTYVEAIHLGGLIYNNNFIRENWCQSSANINFFHLKGFIEILLEELNSTAYLEKINYQISGISKLDIEQNFFHKIKNIGIYSKGNQELIGMLGELDSTYTERASINDSKVYIFELNINKLILSIKPNNHLNYRVANYSNYPSVTRDISIKISSSSNIKSIKNIFLSNHNSLIQSIQVFNEYLDKESGTRSISLRITYESKERTLNVDDIKKIDKDISNVLSQFESKT